jgi:membrane protease YdiL (CAAX protease family)
MQATEVAAMVNREVRKKPQQIASWGRLVGFLLIGAVVAVLGFLAQHAPTGGTGTAAAGQLATHGKAIQICVTVGLMEWALLYYCWVAVHGWGGNLETLSGGRWTSWKSVAIDLGIALPFWILWEGTAYGVYWLIGHSGLAGTSTAKTVDSLLPRSLPEILLWIGVSITAGVCEEMAFRGFLQRQLHALSGSIVVAVLGQGVVFGLFHAYQGWQNVAVISVLGALYGALAAWRGNLRVNIITHAWGDVWSGWLRAVVWR